MLPPGYGQAAGPAPNVSGDCDRAHRMVMSYLRCWPSHVGARYGHGRLSHGNSRIPLTTVRRRKDPGISLGVAASDRTNRQIADRLSGHPPSAIDVPVFVANGDSDPMIPPHYSYLLAGLIPQARVKIYPDAAHGFLFQHHAEFATDVDAFLDGPG